MSRCGPSQSTHPLRLAFLSQKELGRIPIETNGMQTEIQSLETFMKGGRVTFSTYQNIQIKADMFDLFVCFVFPY